MSQQLRFYRLGDAAQLSVSRLGGFIRVWLGAMKIRLPVAD
jgi:hypothetical protein